MLYSPPSARSRRQTRYNFCGLPRKIYCYADETGQDTQGKFFLVAIVTLGESRDEVIKALEDIERKTRKGKRKWFKTRPEYRFAYITEVLGLSPAPLRFARFRDNIDFERMTAIAVSRELRRNEHAGCHATVLIDGLQKSRVARVSKALRQAGANVRKVRGRRDESDALIRLVDAFAGLARLALYARDTQAQQLFEQGRRLGLIEELTG